MPAGCGSAIALAFIFGLIVWFAIVQPITPPQTPKVVEAHIGSPKVTIPDLPQRPTPDDIVDTHMPQSESDFADAHRAFREDIVVHADPLTIARTIVAAKIAALRQIGTISSSEQFISTLDCTSNLDQVRNLEAQASRVAWPRAPALLWHAGQIPADWRSPWQMRVRLDAKGKRGARHPINAMLNAAFAVTAGRLVAYLAGVGLSPAIGFLHADKPGRWSLAWDAIEILRPQIEARLTSFDQAMAACGLRPDCCGRS
jgi:uncharacterized protein YaiI (UPF0178 family)